MCGATFQVSYVGITGCIVGMPFRQQRRIDGTSMVLSLGSDEVVWLSASSTMPTDLGPLLVIGNRPAGLIILRRSFLKLFEVVGCCIYMVENMFF